VRFPGKLLNLWNIIHLLRAIQIKAEETKWVDLENFSIRTQVLTREMR